METRTCDANMLVWFKHYAYKTSHNHSSLLRNGCECEWLCPNCIFASQTIVSTYSKWFIQRCSMIRIAIFNINNYSKPVKLYILKCLLHLYCCRALILSAELLRLTLEYEKACTTHLPPESPLQRYNWLKTSWRWWRQWVQSRWGNWCASASWVLAPRSLI